ncbi:alpha/beta fold hydrolase [Streptomyces fulvoviolaceus]|uniref:alpha/beta fold hydrolase n=1 Tax=Streptomyces fulvoviolaceus TaxID=285535 RepID=UPI0021BF776B|nr:alpha/beta hydrolase [Streptomyces fulvoviolaceus]MCT9080656.1 alpha/beta hydrolase [Streptomyces fulvoviolaceus]
MPADRAGRRPRPGHDVAAGGGAVRVGEPLAHQAVRAELSIDGRRLSYLDFGGTGRPLVALHSHLPEGATFARLAPALSPEWRPIAPDQRGHGESDSAADYSREGYVADVLALLDHLGPARGVLFGRSLGAVNACRFTARHPERAAYEAPTRDALLAGFGPAAPYFSDRLAAGELRRQPATALPLTGDVRLRGPGARRPLGRLDGDLLPGPAGPRHQGGIPAEPVAAMVERRPGTVSAGLDADHLVYTAAPDAFAAALRSFLDTL